MQPNPQHTDNPIFDVDWSTVVQSDKDFWFPPDGEIYALELENGVTEYVKMSFKKEKANDAT